MMLIWTRCNPDTSQPHVSEDMRTFGVRIPVLFD